LRGILKSRFSDLTLSQHEWIQNQFAAAISEKMTQLPIKSQEFLMELECNTYLKIKFKAILLPDLFLFISKIYM
jgi:hypothetical protein